MRKKKRIEPKLLRTHDWWALVDHRDDLPVIFATKQQARENRMVTERIVKVRISELPEQGAECAPKTRQRKARASAAGR